MYMYYTNDNIEISNWYIKAESIYTFWIAKAIRNQKEPQPRKSVHVYAGRSTNHLFGHFYDSQWFIALYYSQIQMTI